jgi:hypothetical protein
MGFIYAGGSKLVAYQAYENLFGTLNGIVTSANFYWLLHISTGLLSSVILDQSGLASTGSMLSANFVWMSFSILTVYIISYRVFSNILVSCFSSAPFFLMPWLYNSDHAPHDLIVFLYSNTVPGLDAIFLYAMTISLLLLCAWGSKLESKSIAVLSGISVAVALMGRGNALMPVLMLTAIPYVFILASLFYRKDRASLVKYCLLHFIPLIAIALYYYSHTWAAINEYYYFVGRELDKPITDKFFGLIWILKNVPGFLFVGRADTLGTYFFSLFSHVLVLNSAYWLQKNLRQVNVYSGRVRVC